MSDTTTSVTSNWRQFKRNPNTTQKFYMIYRDDSRLPEVKHTSAVSATNEAQRLAKKHPGSKVFVLETVDCFLCSVSEPESVELEEL